MDFAEQGRRCFGKRLDCTSGRPQFHERVRGGDRKDRHSCAVSSLDPGVGILDHKAIGRLQGELLGGEEKNIGRWLAVNHIVAAGHRIKKLPESRGGKNRLEILTGCA